MNLYSPKKRVNNVEILHAEIHTLHAEIGKE